MNKLSIKERAAIVRLFVEGNSLRSCSRIADISINTVTSILEKVGEACLKFHDEKVVNVPAKRIEADEIWSFVYAKEKNVPNTTKSNDPKVGDAWTFVAMDADTKLVISWLVGRRDAVCANDFMRELASRLRNRVQLTTDGFGGYLRAVFNAFDDEVDFAQLIKIYGLPEGNSNERRYSPAKCTGSEKRWVSGDPNEALISTSYIERQNLTMRMSMRRFTRLTNGFSKKMENHCYSIAIHFVYSNFCRIHKTLRVTPAMEAKLTDKVMTLEDIVRMAYADELEAESIRLARRNR